MAWEDSALAGGQPWIKEGIAALSRILNLSIRLHQPLLLNESQPWQGVATSEGYP